MTEADWLACTDPRLMLEFLASKASDRKLRLFACACCRRVWHFLTDKRAQEGVEVAERFADGLVSDGDRSAARKAAQQATQSRGMSTRPWAPKWERRAASAVYYALARDGADASGASLLAIEALVWRAGGYAGGDSQAIMTGEQRPQASVLHDIFGNPFRPVLLDPAGRTPTVLALAEAAYDERSLPAGILDTDRLAVLADALEEAGCDNADILSHLRQPGPHVRGCWVIDLLLGKT
jgi:hypothetical protein